MANPLIIGKVKEASFSRPENQSMGILDDYAVRKVVDTKELYVNGVAVTGSGAGASTGAGAPVSTPSAIGALYVDTTNLVCYVAMGTSSSSDWKAVLTT